LLIVLKLIELLRMRLLRHQTVNVWIPRNDFMTVIASGINQSHHKLSQLGFSFSIKATLRALLPAFNCFSLAIASPII